MKSMAIKPRLKLHINGKVSLVANGLNTWTEPEAKAWIQQHYGSIAEFSRRYGFDYLHVLNALDRRIGAVSCAGGIASVRQLLGLRSEPSATSSAQVEAQRRRRDTSYATHQPARASERPDRQNASADCVGGTHTGSRA